MCVITSKVIKTSYDHKPPSSQTDGQLAIPIPRFALRASRSKKIKAVIFYPRDTRSAKRGIATVSRPSVCPSVRLRLTLMYRGGINWVSPKVITRLIPRSPNIGNVVQGEYPQNLQGWGAVYSRRKPAISLKRSKIGPRLLLMTNSKPHTRFRLVPKSTTLDDLERLLRTLFQNTCVFWTNHENLNKDRPMT